MRNSSNRTIYRLWAPIYDRVLGRVYAAGRRRAVELLALRPGERLLVVGVGTGLELAFVPAGVYVVGVDLSPSMLRRAARRRREHVELRLMDAQSLAFAEASFDAVLCCLVVSVVPDGRVAAREAWRVLRPGGRLAIFDKFLAPGTPMSVPRRIFGWLVAHAGTDVNRRLADLIDDLPGLEVCVDEANLLGGRYRVVLATKEDRARESALGGDHPAGDHG